MALRACQPLCILNTVREQPFDGSEPKSPFGNQSASLGGRAAVVYRRAVFSNTCVQHGDRGRTQNGVQMDLRQSRQRSSKPLDRNDSTSVPAISR